MSQRIGDVALVRDMMTLMGEHAGLLDDLKLCGTCRAAAKRCGGTMTTNKEGTVAVLRGNGSVVVRSGVDAATGDTAVTTTVRATRGGREDGNEDGDVDREDGDDGEKYDVETDGTAEET